MKSGFLTWFSATILLIGVFMEEVPKHDWAVEIHGGEVVAKQVAEEMNANVIGKVGSLENIYHLREKTQSRRRTKRDVSTTADYLKNHVKVRWFEYQKDLIRQKRGYMTEEETDKIEQRDADNKIKNMFNDPQWQKEWYLYDARRTRTFLKEDLHVIPVWNMNITGRGVTITIVDDGIEYTHPDLKDNYDPLSSTDVNDNDDDPIPNLAPGTSNEHGTRCASEIAMVANNKICGVGIAYNSKIGGIRLLDGKINDAIEARALGYHRDHIDIYGASWGPSDDGIAMELPGRLVQEALREGAMKGRKGKGNLFVFASGNGGYYNDSCACDGYVSSMYVFSINSISPNSWAPHFAERCSSTIAATFSSAANYDSKLIVADVRGKCTDKHSGTSASAPYAAGIFALALEANPNLTWRDFKHLLSWTCQASSLKSSLPWQQNSAGYWVSEYFGFGEMDATELVKEAMKWTTVPPMKSCTINKSHSSKISSNVASTITIDGTPCYPKVIFIEHVEVKMTFQYSKRGALTIVLKSPHGMNTTLLSERFLDKNKDIMTNWPFISIHNWGEDPRGVWTIFTEDKTKDKKPKKGTVEDVSITFHGTDRFPHHVQVSPNKRRTYDPSYNFLKTYKRHFNKRRPTM